MKQYTKLNWQCWLVENLIDTKCVIFTEPHLIIFEIEERNRL